MNMNPAIRHQFLLDDRWHFLNHGSFGACPKPVFEQYQFWQRELETQPVHFMMRRLPGLLQDVRMRLAAFIHADPDHLILATNATSALNMVIRSLPWQQGDEILSSDQEYGALRRTWEYIVQEKAVTFRPLRLPTDCRDEREFADCIWPEITPRTRAIFLSHITSPTAVRFPFETLIQRAREENIWTIIDGAHAPGQLDLDLSTLGADAYAGNCHKWLCAPKGSAFLYVHPSLQDGMTPLVISHGWREDATFVRSNEWYGTQDFAAYLAIPTALDFFRNCLGEAVHQNCIRRAEAARLHLAERGFTPIIPEDKALEISLFASVLPSSTATTDEVYEVLWKEHQVEVPIIFWQNQNLVRVSIQAYNSDEDWWALAHALERIFH